MESLPAADRAFACAPWCLNNPGTLVQRALRYGRRGSSA